MSMQESLAAPEFRRCHGLRSSQVIQGGKVLHNCAPSYLGPFTDVADLPSRRGICSPCSDCLVQPPVHRSTVGSRAFSVAGPPPEVKSVPSLATFRTRLKTFLFAESCPYIRLIWHFVSAHCIYWTYLMYVLFTIFVFSDYLLLFFKN